ncbi:DUF5331 domain-containing protein [Brasilonema octagenarum]|uniref:DUF5331 domain-containing protein n=1 Tax=Brasilonema octagenarum UFV-OR1 TaxID=417115 RepID=A0ABX1ME70_9CYAN|nr:DUF5331 domain-containing protein [Brasilonema octagenarum]NMF65415.1 hypothetical protein [Brasilonema octagenarum UFV-OR1]
MAFFDSFTESLKQKWLQFFQVNRDWISLHMEVESVYTPDGGSRPPSYLILGVINALEPKLAQLMLPFSKLNPDPDTLDEVLGLNLDPDLALGNRALPKLRVEKHVEESDLSSENLSDETVTNSPRVLNPTRENPTRAKEFQATQQGIDHSLSNQKISHTEFYNAPHSSDESSNLSFDDLKEVDSKTSPATASNQSGFADALSDSWGSETVIQKGEADNKTLLGEEKSSGSLNESEIDRLFPKT